MTDIKKIIEDLEYARYHCTSNKGKDAINDAIDLINRQQAEVEELKSAMNCYRPYEEEQRAEAIKEFAERLKDKFSALKYTIATNRKTVTVDFLQEEVTEMLHGCTTVIDCVVEEFVGDKE